MADAPKSLAAYGWLSIAAAVSTIALKSYAYWLTGSVGLLSDALESVINLLAAVIMVAVLSISARPPDATHATATRKSSIFPAAPKA